jgi:hypothetical protein
LVAPARLTDRTTPSPLTWVQYGGCMMKSRITFGALIMASACMRAACDHAKSTSQVAKDTAAAEQTAADNAAKVQQRADANRQCAWGRTRRAARACPRGCGRGVRRWRIRGEGDYKGGVGPLREGARRRHAEKSLQDQAKLTTTSPGKGKSGRAGADPKP